MNWIQQFGVSLSAFVAAATFFLSAVKYFWDRTDSLRQQTFENYHGLIDELVEGRSSQTVPRVDSQIAVIFELRHYSRYKDVTARILRSLAESWQDSSPRAVDEIHLTLKALGREGA